MLKQIHLEMIVEALGSLGKEIVNDIVVLAQKADAYDKMVTAAKEAQEKNKAKDNAVSAPEAQAEVTKMPAKPKK